MRHHLKFRYNYSKRLPLTEGMQALPPGIWALGLVSLFMDTSSELIHSLLPVFMSTALGASMTTIGLIEGTAEATAAITKIFSGTISDYLGKRKLLAVFGYGLAAVTKPIFPLSNTIGWVFAARFVDRVGKGIRGAPRDALVADIVPSKQRGAAYGLRQALDSVGALIGPILAMVFMVWFVNNIRTVLWIAVVPAFIAMGVLVLGVNEPAKPGTRSNVKKPITLIGVKKLSRRYWLVVMISAIFALARFSEAFLVLRAQSVGLAIGCIPAIMIFMNAVYALTAYPAGIMTDRVSPRTVLVVGLAVLVAADVILAAAASPLPAFIGASLWGLHMGITQGLFAKLVADNAPEELRGTAFGIFNLIGGGSLLLASIIAGVLWSAIGAPATFLSGAAFATLTLMGLILYQGKSPSVQKKDE